MDPNVERRGLLAGGNVVSTRVSGVDIVLQDGLNKRQVHVSEVVRGTKILTAQTIAPAPTRKPNVIFLSGEKLIPRRRSPGYNYFCTISEKGVVISGS